MATLIQIRRDTETNWVAVNPVLTQGELGYDITNDKVKIGDGTSSWNSLSYIGNNNTQVDSDWVLNNITPGQVDSDWILRQIPSDQVDSDWVLNNIPSSQVDSDWVLRQIPSDRVDSDWILRQIPSDQVDSDWVLRQISVDQVDSDWVLRQIPSDQVDSDWVLRQIPVDQVDSDWVLRQIPVDQVDSDWVLRQITHRDSDIQVSSIFMTNDDSVGKLSWNYDDSTLDVQINAVTLQVGQEQVFYGKATEVIADGGVAMFAGAQGGHTLIKNANPTDIGFFDEAVIGIATETIANNGFGFVTTYGKVRNLDTSAFAEGALLYLSPDQEGVLIDSEPTAPNHKLLIGAVLRSHATEGIIFVRPTFGHHISENHDVLVTDVSNGDILTWDATASVWKNVPNTKIPEDSDWVLKQIANSSDSDKVDWKDADSDVRALFENIKLTDATDYTVTTPNPLYTALDSDTIYLDATNPSYSGTFTRVSTTRKLFLAIDNNWYTTANSVGPVTAWKSNNVVGGKILVYIQTFNFVSNYNDISSPRGYNAALMDPTDLNYDAAAGDIGSFGISMQGSNTAFASHNDDLKQIGSIDVSGNRLTTITTEGAGDGTLYNVLVENNVASTPVDGQVIAWDNTNNRYTNVSIAQATDNQVDSDWVLRNSGQGSVDSDWVLTQIPDNQVDSDWVLSQIPDNQVDSDWVVSQILGTSANWSTQDIWTDTTAAIGNSFNKEILRTVSLPAAGTYQIITRFTFNVSNAFNAVAGVWLDGSNNPIDSSSTGYTSSSQVFDIFHYTATGPETISYQIYTVGSASHQDSIPMELFVSNMLSSVSGGGSGSGLEARKTVSGTTASLADGATGNVDITGEKAYSLFKIQTDGAAWVRLYVSDAARTADSGRAETTDPSPGAGVIAEVITTGAETIYISPGAIGFNDESTPTTTIPLAVTNKTGSTGTVAVTLTILKMEQ